MKTMITLVRQGQGNQPRVRLVVPMDLTDRKSCFLVSDELGMMLQELLDDYNKNPRDCRLVLGLRPEPLKKD